MMTSEKHALITRGLVVGYQGRPLLPAFDWEVASGQFWALLGSNGSGKSTIVKTVLGLLDRVGGEISHRTGDIGFVPQRSGLDLSIPSRSRDVIEAGATRGWNFVDPFFRRKMAARLDRVVEATDTGALLSEQMANLSEGQKQRVLIARALMAEPKLLVLDEPTSAMDYQAERRTLDLIMSLQEQFDLAVVMVCHNLALVAEYASHALMVDREHQMILEGDIREVAYADACQAHFGLVLRQAVDTRFGSCERPEDLS
ncbi:MAG: ATP-binding cassette domain-containing protein [Myxococcota bacterium]|nr:ATP-binding cassette domain-containing protein [Myxococcota bacterium]